MIVPSCGCEKFPNTSETSAYSNSAAISPAKTPATFMFCDVARICKETLGPAVHRYVVTNTMVKQ